MIEIYLKLNVLNVNYIFIEFYQIEPLNFTFNVTPIKITLFIVYNNLFLKLIRINQNLIKMFLTVCFNCKPKLNRL